MVDITKVQLNPIPLPIVELQKENLELQRKSKVFQKIIFGAIAVGVLTLIYYIVKDESNKEK
jgi:hypothetical protein